MKFRDWYEKEFWKKCLVKYYGYSGVSFSEAERLADRSVELLRERESDQA